MMTTGLASINGDDTEGNGVADYFRGLTFYFIPTNFPKSDLQELKSAAERNGASVVDIFGSPRSNGISAAITALRTKNRIEKHLNGVYHQIIAATKGKVPESIPVLPVSWVKDCLDKRQALPFEGYIKCLYAPPDNLQSTVSVKSEMSVAKVPQNGVDRTLDELSEDSSGEMKPISRKRKVEQDDLMPSRAIKRLQSESNDSDNTSEDSTTTVSTASNASSYSGYMTDDETSSSIKKIPSEEVTRPHLLDHHNKELVSQLKIIARQRQLMRDETRRYSKLSYERAISALIAHPRRVSSMDEVRNIPHIGSKIATKIGEFLSHGMISEAQDIQNSEWFHVCDTFAKIYGVGAKTAVEWYSKGYRSVEDVLEDDEFMQSLPETTRYGVEMFHDFQQRFDRPHAERLIKFITDELHQFDKRYIVTPVGGYCRGKTNLGDLDLIISYPASAITQSPTLQPVTNTDEPRLKNIKDFDVIDHLTRKLVDDGIIKYILSFTKRRDLSDQPAEVQEKYRVKSRIVKSAQKSLKLRMKRAAKEKTGGFDSLEKAFVAIKIPSDEHYRQLDLIFAPPEQYATGVLGWMGSTSIERSLRRVADSRGYSFSSDGLFNKGTGEYEVIKTEREIWDKLGLKYLEPWERNAD